MTGLEPAVVMAIAAGASAAASGAGMYMQQRAARQQAQFQAQVAANNAEIARQDGIALGERAEVAEDDHRRRINQAIGTARSQGAATGFVIDQDTNQTLQQDLAEAGQMDILRHRDSVALERRRIEVGATNLDAQSTLFAHQASNINPLLAGATTFLGAASQRSEQIKPLFT